MVLCEKQSVVLNKHHLSKSKVQSTRKVGGESPGHGEGKTWAEGDLW